MSLGSIRLSNTRDGNPGIAIIQFNEDHTFPANAVNNVNIFDSQVHYINRFTCFAVVDGTLRRLPFVPSINTPTENNSYVLRRQTFSPRNVFNVTGGQSSNDDTGNVLTYRTIARNFTAGDDTTMSYETVFVVRVNNIDYEVTTESRISTAQAGSNQFISVSADRRTFTFDTQSSTTSTDTAITLTATSFPTSGVLAFASGTNFTWEQSVDGGETFTSRTAGVGGADNSTLTIEASSFAGTTDNPNNDVIYRVSRDTTTDPDTALTFTDRTTVFRLVNPDAAAQIILDVVRGALDFRNKRTADEDGAFNGTEVDLSARLFRDNVEVTDLTGIEFNYNCVTVAFDGTETVTPITGSEDFATLGSSGGAINNLLTLTGDVFGGTGSDGVSEFENVRLDVSCLLQN